MTRDSKKYLEVFDLAARAYAGDGGSADDPIKGELRDAYQVAKGRLIDHLEHLEKNTYTDSRLDVQHLAGVPVQLDPTMPPGVIRFVGPEGQSVVLRFSAEFS